MPTARQQQRRAAEERHHDQVQRASARARRPRTPTSAADDRAAGRDRARFITLATLRGERRGSTVARTDDAQASAGAERPVDLRPDGRERSCARMCSTTPMTSRSCSGAVAAGLQPLADGVLARPRAGREGLVDDDGVLLRRVVTGRRRARPARACPSRGRRPATRCGRRTVSLSQLRAVASL